MDLKIIVEDRIPFVKGVLEPYAEVKYLPASEITAAEMKDADALITRTRTRCDVSLLAGSKASLIASATIGTDHIDIPWCQANGITVANAPGCNAPAVAQYVMAAILTNYPDPRGLTLGIVGVGNVGKLVEQRAKSLGMKVLRCDPPRARMEGEDGFVSHDEILRNSDVITYHTPLIKEGEDKTVHLFDMSAVAKLGHKPMIINTCRGPVTSTDAMIEGLESGKIGSLVIDCWENEPAISRRLLELTHLATPHIAGYSKEGKIRASQTALSHVSRHFRLPELHVSLPEGEEMPGPVPESVTAEQIIKSYDIEADTQALKSSPETFEEQRNTYNLRREPS